MQTKLTSLHARKHTHTSTAHFIESNRIVFRIVPSIILHHFKFSSKIGLMVHIIEMMQFLIMKNDVFFLFVALYCSRFVRLAYSSFHSLAWNIMERRKKKNKQPYPFRPFEIYFTSNINFYAIIIVRIALALSCTFHICDTGE